MRSERIMLSIVTYIFMTACLVGCAVPSVNGLPEVPKGTGESLRPGYEVVYNPVIRSEVNVNNLVYGNQSCQGIDGPRFTEVHMADKGDHLLFSYFNSGKRQEAGRLYYHEIINQRIAVERYVPSGEAIYIVTLYGNNGTYDIYSYTHGNCNALQNYDKLTKIADNIYRRIIDYTDKYNKSLDVVKSWSVDASRHLNAYPVPSMTEPERKLIVQAENLTEKRNYAAAINKYNELLTIKPVTYPKAFYNLALLFEMLSQPLDAIACMKIYLMFEPEGEDARDAQDKIYTWELMAPPPKAAQR